MSSSAGAVLSSTSVVPSLVEAMLLEVSPQSSSRPRSATTKMTGAILASLIPYMTSLQGELSLFSKRSGFSSWFLIN